MDDIVRQAIAKWPNVPDCYGWLGLDARGNWYMRDDRTQAAGPFSSADGGTPASRGSLLRHEKLVDFIQRNYESDAQGHWFFQNGPQRVYVELDLTPMVWRVAKGAEGFTVTAHTGVPARPVSCVLDELGRLYLQCQLESTHDAAPVLGLVHTQDVGLASDAIEQGLWAPQDAASTGLPARYGYVRSPRRAAPMKKTP
jgi:hypothetical protein